MILVSPTLAALGINVYDSFGEYVHKRILSVQGVESLNFKECRRVSIAMEAQLQRALGAPEPPDETVEWLVSRGPDMGMKPEQEERERAVTVAKQDFFFSSTATPSVRNPVTSSVCRVRHARSGAPASGGCRPWEGPYDTDSTTMMMMPKPDPPVAHRSRKRRAWASWNARPAVHPFYSHEMPGPLLA